MFSSLGRIRFTKPHPHVSHDPPLVCQLIKQFNWCNYFVVSASSFVLLVGFLSSVWNSLHIYIVSYYSHHVSSTAILYHILLSLRYTHWTLAVKKVFWWHLPTGTQGRRVYSPRATCVSMKNCFCFFLISYICLLLLCVYNKCFCIECQLLIKTGFHVLPMCI